MKFTIILLLCGIVCASAQPRCTKDEFDECNPSGEEEVKDIETVEQLNDMCRYVNTIVKCEVDFMDRCSNYPPSGRRSYLREQYRMFGGFCDESNPLRKKFLDNAKCLNRVGKEAPDSCGFQAIKSCEDLRSALKCAEEMVADECGEDARQAYVYALNPEYHLRDQGCL